MRDYVLFYVNGRRFEVRGEAAFSSLTDFLRDELLLVGTKVVCAEGDCGACTVLVGRLDGQGLRYETVDACIQFLYQLDCRSILTIEGLVTDGRLHPIQQAMVDHHGSQCGFCTPGFVMALAGAFTENQSCDCAVLKTELTGNLCRCTGYLPILEAGQALDPAALPDLANQGTPAELVADLQTHARVPVVVRSAQHTFFAPHSLEEAVAFKAEHPQTPIIAGGTELGVLRNKKGLNPATLLSLARVPELDQIVARDEDVVIGANVTWSQMEAFAKERLPEFYPIILRFGSPQIRHVATLMGNVVHGSPIADSLPFLFVMDAELELRGRQGSRRVKLNGFYKGYKIRDQAPEEIATHVFVPLPTAKDLLKLYKVSRRNDLDIATFGAAIRVQRISDRIDRAWVAYSGVGPTVARLAQTEAFLTGKPFTEETFQAAARAARTEIQPISDVRGSRDFRLQLAGNILRKFYYDYARAELDAVDPRSNGKLDGANHDADR
jgi:xanthine dehydrogenase small subunit